MCALRLLPASIAWLGCGEIGWLMRAVVFLFVDACAQMQDELAALSRELFSDVAYITQRLAEREYKSPKSVSVLVLGFCSLHAAFPAARRSAALDWPWLLDSLVCMSCGLLVRSLVNSLTRDRVHRRRRCEERCWPRPMSLANSKPRSVNSAQTSSSSSGPGSCIQLIAAAGGRRPRCSRACRSATTTTRTARHAVSSADLVLALC